MNTLIVDDVKLSRDGLSVLINTHFQEANIVGSVPSVEAARKLLKAEQVDLLFLDIQLQDGLSFDILDDVSMNSKVIFITAYEKYAIEALRKGAFDYLLKPINVSELKKCIERIRELRELENEHLAKASDSLVFKEKIGISSMDGIEYVNTAEISYLKADGKYTMVCLKNNTITSSKNLKMFEVILPESSFMRVHHSYLVNLSQVVRFKKDDVMLVLEDGTEIPVAKSRKDLLTRRLIHI
ncbi:MAG TPA: LytTR family DNA-binding domain-containing protein [Fluviicola sp.]|nr:LytTR family DNA-binding domain-containing protein [Fluviicola sp.]